MKISWFVLFVILLVYLTCPAQADELTGRDIAFRMDAVDRVQYKKVINE